MEQTLMAPREADAVHTLRPLYNTAIAFIVLNSVFIVLRFFTVLKLRSKRLALTWDDWLLLPAYLCCLGISICALNMVHYEEVGDVPGDQVITDLDTLKPVLKALFALLELLSPAYAFTRFSILALYLRVFTNRIVRLLSYAMIALLACQWIAFAFATAFQCSPAAFYWDRTIPGGKCVDVNAYNRSFTPVNVAFDVIILALPMPTIWTLRISRLRKSGITFVLALGLIALAASLARLVTLETTTTTLIAPEYSDRIVPWLVIEPGLYLITACLPAMQPLFRVLTPAPLRRMLNGQIDLARDKRNATPNRHRQSILGVKASAPFERLDDPLAEPSDSRNMSMNIATAEARMARNNSASKNTDSSIMHELENGQDVPLEDLKKMTTGDGIFVHTEISVTQEQKIGEVLDF